MKFALKIIAVPVISVVAAVFLSAGPCTVLGGRWCGYKSEPPYFFELLAFGAFLGAAISSAILFWPKRQR